MKYNTILNIHNSSCFSSSASAFIVIGENISARAIKMRIEEYLHYKYMSYKDIIQFGNDIMKAYVRNQGKQRLLRYVLDMAFIYNKCLSCSEVTRLNTLFYMVFTPYCHPSPPLWEVVINNMSSFRSVPSLLDVIASLEQYVTCYQK